MARSFSHSFRALPVWFRERRRLQSETELQWDQQEQEHVALLQTLRGLADHDSYESFYGANDARRGDDVLVGEIAEVELRWAIRWLPRTSEVVAFPVGWIEEQSHQVRVRVAVPLGSVGNTSGIGGRVVTTAPLPTVVLILGTATSADDTRTRISEATTLDAIRTVLD